MRTRGGCGRSEQQNPAAMARQKQKSS